MLGTSGITEFAELVASYPSRVQLPEQLEAFFAASGYVPSSPYEKRRSVRKYFRCRAVVELVQCLPAVSRDERFGGILMRDLSQFGAGFLFHLQLFPEEVVRIWLPGRSLEGRVAFCRYRGPQCYDVGMSLLHIHRHK